MATTIAEFDYVGTDLKFLVEPTASGFNKTEDDWEVEVSRGNGKVFHFDRDDLARDEEDNFYVCFSTETYGSGLYMITIIAHVPDVDFEDGYREEVENLALINIKKPKK